MPGYERQGLPLISGAGFSTRDPPPGEPPLPIPAAELAARVLDHHTGLGRSSQEGDLTSVDHHLTRQPDPLPLPMPAVSYTKILRAKPVAKSKLVTLAVAKWLSPRTAGFPNVKNTGL